MRKIEKAVQLAFPRWRSPVLFPLLKSFDNDLLSKLFQTDNFPVYKIASASEDNSMPYHNDTPSSANIQFISNSTYPTRETRENHDNNSNYRFAYGKTSFPFCLKSVNSMRHMHRLSLPIMNGVGVRKTNENMKSHECQLWRSFAVIPRSHRRRKPQQDTRKGIAARLPPRNNQITAGELRVVFPPEEEKQPAIMALPEAMKEAESRGLDLVLIAPSADPPVARLADFKKVVYSLQQKEKAASKAARENKKLSIPKEIRMKCFIAEHDLSMKLDQANKWLEEGYNVKIAIRFRGARGIEPGKELLNRVLEKMKDTAEVVDPRALQKPQMNQWLVMFTSAKVSAKKDK